MFGRSRTVLLPSRPTTLPGCRSCFCELPPDFSVISRRGCCPSEPWARRRIRSILTSVFLGYSELFSAVRAKTSFAALFEIDLSSHPISLPALFVLFPTPWRGQAFLPSISTVHGLAQTVDRTALATLAPRLSAS